MNSIQDLLILLKQSSPVLGVPLLLGGAVLMTFGWRLSRVCMAITFAVIGYAGGLMLAETSEQLEVFPWYGACGLTLIAVVPPRYGVSLAGGLTATTAIFYAMKSFGLFGPALWVGAGVVLFCATGLCAVRRRYVVIILSSVEGSMLLVAGLLAMVVTSAAAYETLKGMMSTSGVVAPFLLIVPTVMSFFYQISEVRRAGSEM